MHKRMCPKGSKHALIVGDKVYALEGGAADKLDEQSGTRAVVSGIVQGDTIRVKSVTAESSAGGPSKR
jgi:hypothetical protein